VRLPWGDWDPNWFPVFSNGGGDFYAVQLAKNPTKDGAVIGYIRGEPEQEVAFESLLSMVRTISACYDASAYYVSAGGYLEANYNARSAIARKFNPTLDQYKS
jgi:cell wall assembly regulator SMI1